MDHTGVLALFDRDMREGARPDAPGACVERAGRVVRQIGEGSGWTGVLWSGLDENTADALHALLRDMHSEFGLTAIIATHNPRLAEQCDRVLRVEAGRLATG